MRETARAVYTDVTHDGAEDLVVLEMETGNEPILIHEDRPDMEQVTPWGNRYRASSGRTWNGRAYFFTYPGPGRGRRLYLQKQDGLVYLLWCTPLETERFFLSADGKRMTAEDVQPERSDNRRRKLLLAVLDPEARAGFFHGIPG